MDYEEGKYKKYFKMGYSRGEYRMDLDDFEDKIKTSFKNYTHSIHAYGDIGETPGLASLFQPGPTVLVEDKKKKKKWK